MDRSIIYLLELLLSWNGNNKRQKQKDSNRASVREKNSIERKIVSSSCRSYSCSSGSDEEYVITYLLLCCCSCSSLLDCVRWQSTLDSEKRRFVRLWPIGALPPRLGSCTPIDVQDFRSASQSGTSFLFFPHKTCDKDQQTQISSLYQLKRTIIEQSTRLSLSHYYVTRTQTTWKAII